MRDIEMREALIRHLRHDHLDQTDNRIWSELALCLGASRVDVCLINGSLSGFEIKSPRDDLSRLPNQVFHYGQVLDYACIVTTDKHASRAMGNVPDWWGVMYASDHGKDVVLNWARYPTRNLSVDPLSLAQLLWREEALTELKVRGVHDGLARSTRWEIWDRLVDELDIDELGEVVRRNLKARPIRRVDELLLTGDVT